MIIFVRHGERSDQSPLSSERNAMEKSYDPHLTKVGCQQAQQTGKFLVNLLEQHASKFNMNLQDVEPVILSSPFLRCIMTSKHVASQLPRVYKNSIFIQEEFGEVMYSCDFSFNVLPELHIRVADFKYLDEKYFNLGSVNLCKKYFENKNFIQPKCPESHSQIVKRISNNTHLLFELYIKNHDFKKHPIICMTHQGVLELQQEIMDSLNVSYGWIQYCAVTQIIFPKCDEGNLQYEVPIKGDCYWKK